MTGSVFGSLTVVGLVTRPGRHRFYLCSCSCGGSRVARRDHLLRGATISCGCARKRHVRHGEARGGGLSVEYLAWKGMNGRCSNPLSPQWVDYGGRGIAVCEGWRQSFTLFLADIGRRPSPNMSIDRIDNDGDYEPGNVRWATRRQQSENRRNTRWVMWDGRVQTIAKWGRDTGLGSALRGRINRGWSTKRAMTTPLNNRHRSGR